MSQRIFLFFSIALTAFALMIIGAAIGSGRLIPAATVHTTLDPQLLAQLQAREAAYQAMIAQANSQLQATNPPATQNVAPASTQEPTAGYPISPELAAYLALTVAPGSYLLNDPALVNFQGTVAYEVVLSTGRVYVDASSGAILFNGAAAQSGGGGTGSGRGGESDGESD
jgi:uncharacterized membrane protein YkoI